MILIRGGQVLTEAGMRSSDVLVDGDHVVDVAVDIPTEGVTVVDGTGCMVGPGLVDLHVHLREPGQTWKEDVASGSRAAAAGGFTAVVAMPNTEPPLDDSDRVRQVRELAEGVGLIEVSVAAAVTVSRAGREVADLESLYESGVRLFSDDGDTVTDDELLEDAMRRIAALGAVLAQHAEDSRLTTGRHMSEGEVSRRLGLAGIPHEAEDGVVARDLEVARRTGARYHCQHVSSAGAVALIRRAKAQGLAVTAEVTPHHLVFCDEDVASLDTNFKMYPPLRSRRDRSTLREALRDGTIDVVATDHAPHATEEKLVPFEEAPRGVIGLETAAAATWETLEDPVRFFEALSVTPARIAGMQRQGRPIAVGGPANIVVFDPEAEWEPAQFVSRSANSPFLGRRMQGRVLATIYEGEPTHLLERTR